MLLHAMLWLGLTSAPAAGAGTEVAVVGLRWYAAPGCPDEADVAQQLRGLMAGRTDTSARGRVTGRAGDYRLDLEVETAGHRETRRLHAADCGLLTQAGVLVIAVTADSIAATAWVLDQERSSSEPELQPGQIPPPPVEGPTARVETSTSPTGASPPTTSVASAGTRERSGAPSPAPPSPRPPRRRAERVHGTLGAGIGVSAGLTPASPSAGLEGSLGLRWGSLRLVATGFHWLARTRQLEPGAGVRAALSGGGLRGCYALAHDRVELPLCVGVDAAAMHGAGTGPAVRPLEVRDLWVGVALSGGLGFALTERFALRARVDGVLAARRPAMALRVGEEIRHSHRMPPLGARLLVTAVIGIF